MTTLVAVGQRLAGPQATAFQDPRIDAAVVYSPNAPRNQDPDAALGAIRVPILHFTGTDDRTPFDLEATPEGRQVPFRTITGADQFFTEARLKSAVCQSGLPEPLVLEEFAIDRSGPPVDLVDAARALAPESPAKIFFTSGTTGAPKAVTRLLSDAGMASLETDQTSALPQTFRPPGVLDDWSYGIGLWCERRAGGRCSSVSSAGAFGTYPWIDRTTGAYGVAPLRPASARHVREPAGGDLDGKGRRADTRRYRGAPPRHTLAARRAQSGPVRDRSDDR